MLLTQMTAMQQASLLMSSLKTQPIQPQAHSTETDISAATVLLGNTSSHLKERLLMLEVVKKKITWQGVKEVSTSSVADNGFCGVKPEYGFDKMTLADVFLLFWPGDP